MSAGFGAAIVRRFAAGGARVIAAAIAEPIDCLVNNAGLVLGLGSAATADPDDWDRMVQATRAVLPGMYPYPGGNVYGATKAFVHQFGLNLRSDLHGTGVRVTCIEPGMCGGTEFSTVRFGGDATKAQAAYAGSTSLVVTVGNIVKVLPWLIVSRPNAAALLVCLPLVPLGVWAGWRLHDRLDQRRLYQLCYGLMILTAVKLLWDGLAGR